MFDAPVPANPVASSVNWLTGTMLGNAAVAICVIAVALVGYSMLTGRLPIRRGGEVIVGCFLLLGAPAVAVGILDFVENRNRPTIAAPDIIVYEARPREELR